MELCTQKWPVIIGESAMTKKVWGQCTPHSLMLRNCNAGRAMHCKVIYIKKLLIKELNHMWTTTTPSRFQHKDYIRYSFYAHVINILCSLSTMWNDNKLIMYMYMHRLHISNFVLLWLFKILIRIDNEELIIG